MTEPSRDGTTPPSCPDASTASATERVDGTSIGALSRRGFLGGVVGASALLAGCSDRDQNNGPRGPGGRQGNDGMGGQQTTGRSWMAGVGNYEGYDHHMDADSITIAVGAAGNDGNYAFDPPAVLLSPGTRVVWQWTGQGGKHGVVDRDGAFESDVSAEAGHTFQHRFENVGVYRYYCPEHRSLGMRGVVAVTR